jgi:hypothetical protein
MHKSRASLTPKTSHQVFTSDVLARHEKVKTRDAAVERSRTTAGIAAEKDKEALAPDAGRDRANAFAQRGWQLTGHQIIERLKKLNSRLIFQPSVNTSGKTTGIYIEDLSLGVKGLRYLGISFQTEMNPEFDVIEDQEGAMYGSCKERGWRTVLARLIRERLITEYSAETVFGIPSHDSERWMQALSRHATT